MSTRTGRCSTSGCARPGSSSARPTRRRCSPSSTWPTGASTTPTSCRSCEPWTLEPDGERQRHSLQYYWRCWSGWTRRRRGSCRSSVWVDGTLVGMQGMLADHFAVTRTFETGSWLGLAHQGQGIGKEMRAAILHFGFVGLGALRADTGAIDGNDRSRRASPAPSATRRTARPSRTATASGSSCNEFRLERADWEPRRRDDITIEGLEPCLELFGLGRDGRRPARDRASAGSTAAGPAGCWRPLGRRSTGAAGDRRASPSVEVRVVPTLRRGARPGARRLARGPRASTCRSACPTRGQRAADRAARRRLGPRRSSVFPTPVRAALRRRRLPRCAGPVAGGRRPGPLEAGLQPAAAASPRSTQAMTPELQDRVFECHPETAFARLGGTAADDHQARRPRARAERRPCSHPWLGRRRRSSAPPPRGAKADDVLDALAVAVTAGRFTVGDVEHLGDGDRRRPRPAHGDRRLTSSRPSSRSPGNRPAIRAKIGARDVGGHMQRLTGLDDGFLWMETPTSPHARGQPDRGRRRRRRPDGADLRAGAGALRVPPRLRAAVPAPARAGAVRHPPPAVDRGPRLRPRLAPAPHHAAGRPRRRSTTSPTWRPSWSPSRSTAPARCGRCGSSTASTTATSACSPRCTTPPSTARRARS